MNPRTFRTPSAAALAAALLGIPALPAPAGTPAPAPTDAGQRAADAWERVNDWSVAEVLFPSLHMHGAGGASSTGVGGLSSGAHDPKRGAFSAQAVEPGLSLRTKYLEAFSNYLFYQDADGDWDGELEEAFGKFVNIPGGFEIKGGRFLSRYGTLNDKHLHAWDFVDSETVLSRFLGDDGLVLQGGEVSWTLPLEMDPAFVSIASLGFGNAPTHEHGHSHDHGGAEPPHEGEEAALADDIWTARLMGRYRFSDFHSVTAGLSAAGGTNGFGRDTGVFGLDAEYLWRENGLEPGGRAFRWRTELLYRDVDAFSQHDDDDDGIIDEEYSGNYNEWGFYTHAIYTHNHHLDASLRVGWTEGVDDFGQDERLRVSPALTWWIDSSRRIGLRTQYNWDILPGGEEEHSLWFQINFAFGSGNEVR